MHEMILLLISFSIGILFGALLTTFFQKKSYERQRAEFESLSAQALRQNNESFLQLASISFEKLEERAKGELAKKEVAIDALVKPVKESLDKFDTKINELEKSRTIAQVSLKEQITALFEVQKSLKSETHNLVKALRRPAVRGRWGEIQLKRVVELAGMLAHCDFFEQPSVSSEEGRFRPDLLVKLPGQKNIVIDAKAPLEAYLESIECEDDATRKVKLELHAKQIRNHITLLSRKSYWDQFESTPEFVVLFLPGETFFSAALEHDPTLIEMGAHKQVILATPTTLIALLRAVAYGWRQERLSEKAETIQTLGKELYKRISDLSSHFSKVGKSLSSAVSHYNKAAASLESRVLVSARRFNDLAPEKPLEPLEQIEVLPKELISKGGNQDIH